MGINARVFAPSVASTLETGRSEILDALVPALAKERTVVLYGSHASGKTALLARAMQATQFRDPLRVHVSLQDYVWRHGPTSAPKALYRDLLDQLGGWGEPNADTVRRTLHAVTTTEVSFVFEGADLLITPTGRALAQELARLLDNRPRGTAVAFLTHVPQQAAETLGIREVVQHCSGSADEADVRPLRFAELLALTRQLAPNWDASDARLVAELTGGLSGLVSELARRCRGMRMSALLGSAHRTDGPLVDYFQALLKALANRPLGFRLLDALRRERVLKRSELEAHDVAFLLAWNLGKLRGSSVCFEGVPVVVRWLEEFQPSSTAVG